MSDSPLEPERCTLASDGWRRRDTLVPHHLLGGLPDKSVGPATRELSKAACGRSQKKGPGIRGQGPEKGSPLFRHTESASRRGMLRAYVPTTCDNINAP